MSSKELKQISQQMMVIQETHEDSGLAEKITKLGEAVDKTAESWSGSWLGYQAYVYYENFSKPPAGGHFSQEWGLNPPYFNEEYARNWQEADPKEVKEHVLALAELVDLKQIENRAQELRVEIEKAKSDAISILYTCNPSDRDSFVSKLSERVEALKLLDASDILNNWAPSGQTMTRDMVAASQGQYAPPHLKLWARATEYTNLIAISRKLSEHCIQAASHLNRQIAREQAESRIGTDVFIGHGRSHVWKDLKDFVQDRLGLPWEEFNRVPVAGITNQQRLSEMLDAAAVAFIVMTAEDENADGKMQARMNVIHEVGLFQGRLGFTKAIVLLEEGCEEFSNIQGLGQIRFPTGNISAVFEEIRQVLEREGLLSSDNAS